MTAISAPVAAPLVRPLQVGPHRVDPPVVLAPMAGVTNAAFRGLCRSYGDGLFVSEMITARALIERHDRTLAMARFTEDERPRSIQLYGTDPTTLAEAVRQLLDADGVEHIDMNFGCPVKKVTRHGGGSALPFKRTLLRRIIASVVAAAGDVPVTIKFRKGIDDDHLTFLDTGRIAEGEGVAAIALHARTAEQLYSGQADWDAIAELKATVTSIPVLGNGDVWRPEDALTMVAHTGCDGVVVGRGCLGRPWLFGELADAFAGRPVRPAPPLGTVADTIRDHTRRLADLHGERSAIRDIRKHTGWYLRGYAVGPEVRRDLNQVDSYDELDRRLDDLDRTLELPPESVGLARGHQHGPRPVTLPQGFYDAPDDGRLLGRGAEAVTSGG